MDNFIRDMKGKHPKVDPTYIESKGRESFNALVQKKQEKEQALLDKKAFDNEVNGLATQFVNVRKTY